MPRADAVIQESLTHLGQTSTYKNGNATATATAKFYYGTGIAGLDYTDGRLSVCSNKLDISVRTIFITLADFEGGTLDKLRGAGRIQNTVIKDYKHLNNMLASINTLFRPADF